MVDTYLVPENSVVSAKGDGEPLGIGGAAHTVFLLVLRISETVEQESIDVAVFGSPDGTTWDPKPLGSFPQKFYKGETPMLLDLRSQESVKFVRAHWEVNRWGRGPEEPRFVFDVKIRNVPPEVLAEARREAQNFR
jgi:hypothetical protein